MGFWSAVSNALGHATAGVPSNGGIVTTNPHGGYGGQWGIYAGNHRIVTVLDRNWNGFNRGEVAVIPDTVFASFDNQKHYYHVITKDYGRYILDAKSYQRAREMAVQREIYNGRSVDFVMELCELPHPREIIKSGRQWRTVFPDEF